MIAVPPPVRSMTRGYERRAAATRRHATVRSPLPPDSQRGTRMSENAPSPRTPWWQAHVELIVVIMLGVVSVATAYTSFQSGLYGGGSDDRISKSEAAG